MSLSLHARSVCCDADGDPVFFRSGEWLDGIALGVGGDAVGGNAFCRECIGYGLCTSGGKRLVETVIAGLHIGISCQGNLRCRIFLQMSGKFIHFAGFLGRITAELILKNTFTCIG